MKRDDLPPTVTPDPAWAELIATASAPYRDTSRWA